MISNNITCPLCGSATTKTIVTALAWKIEACQVCTNAWTSPLPRTVIDYKQRDFYAIASPGLITAGASRLLGDLPAQWRRSITMQKQLLSHCLAPGAKILEIGCGEGILLNELSRAGFKVQGIEPSQTASARARARGLDVIEGYFPSKTVDGPVDAIIFSHVLEHMPDPLDVLSRAAQLAPKGHLFLVQTNYKGLMALWRKAEWYAWVPEDHYWHFTPSGLVQLAKNAGWQYEKCEFSSLVHSQLVDRLVVKVASVFPQLLDQFHLLLKTSEAGVRSSIRWPTSTRGKEN